jgi:Glycosyltransferase family 87
LFICWLPTSIAGFADAQHVLLSLKALNIVLLVLTALAIYRYQDDDKRGWIAAYLFIGNPMVLFECIGNAHNDIIMAVFVIAAVLYFKRRSLLSAPLLMLSVLVKFFSASLFPLLVLGMLLKRWAKERLALSGLIALVPLVLTPLPFWAGGKMLSGLAAGTQVAQSLNSASLFSLMREYLRQGTIAPGTETLVQNAFLVVFALCALIVMWLVWRGRPLESGLTDTFLLFAVLVSLLTPWYLIPALALIALRHNRVELGYLFAATTLGLVYHPLSVWAWFNSGLSVFQIHLFQGACLTGPILGLFLVEIGRNVTRRGRRTAVAAA